MNELLKFNIAKHIPITEEELLQFGNLLVPRSFKRKEYLLQEGEVCLYEGFVTKGLFRIYHLDNNGFEQNLYFAPEDWWVTDIDSFTNEKSSNLFIEARKNINSQRDDICSLNY